MYGMLLISSDENLSTLAMKFVPHINKSFRVHYAKNRNMAEKTLEENKSIDVVVVDHDEINSMYSVLNALARGKYELPVVVVLKEPTVEILGDALNEHIDQYVRRGSRIPNDFFNELCQKCVITIEKDRSEKQRRINEKRMEALITIAKMSDRNFSEIVDYAVEKSLELTDSEIGYVSMYNKNTRKLRMMSWSSSAMKQCAMTNYPLDFNLDETGVWGEPVRQGKPIIINNYETETRSSKKGTPMGHVPLKKLLMAPIMYDGHIVGTAGVGNKTRDYNWFDEIQLTMIMSEMFSIYFQLESARNYSYETSAIKDLINSGPIGFLMVDQKMQIRFMNGLASNILCCDVTNDLPIPLDSLECDGMKSIQTLIKTLIMTGENQRSTIEHEKDDQRVLYDVRVSNIMEGYAITFNDITEVHKKDEKISRALEHIGIIEGPVLDNLKNSNTRIQSIAPCIVGDHREAIRMMNEAVLFMDSYRDVGIMEPVWMDLRMTILHGAEKIDTGNTIIDIHVKDVMVKADPAFHSVFSNLIDNSIFHGEQVGIIEIRYRIAKGNLLIVYKDNGTGFDIRNETWMSLVNKGKFGLFLINKIVSASGFTLRLLNEGPGATFEISVPPDNYSIG